MAAVALWTSAFCCWSFTNMHFIIHAVRVSYGFVKWLERNGVTIYPCLYLRGKICRRKLRRNSDCSDSGDCGILLEVFWILRLCTQKIRKNRYGFCFPYRYCIRFMIVVPGGLGIGFIFYMLSSDSSRNDLVDFRIDFWNPSFRWNHGNYLLQGFPGDSSPIKYSL